jgi:hypothetical protein
MRQVIDKLPQHLEHGVRQRDLLAMRADELRPRRLVLRKEAPQDRIERGALVVIGGNRPRT